MPQVLIGRDPEQPAAGLEAGGQLKIGNIGPAVAAAEPVLLLGKIVMANAGAVQLAQGELGGAEIGEVAMGFCQMQRDAVDETAHQRLPAGPQQLRPDVEIARQRQRVALAGEQMAGERIGPGRHLIEPAQHRVDLAGIVAETAAFDGREHVALQQHAFGPARRQNGGIVFGQAHDVTPPPLHEDDRRSSDRDRQGRER